MEHVIIVVGRLGRVNCLVHKTTTFLRNRSTNPLPTASDPLPVLLTPYCVLQRVAVGCCTRYATGKLLEILGQQRYVQRVRVVSESQKPGVESVLMCVILDVDTCNHVDIIKISKQSFTTRVLIVGAGVKE